MKFVSLFAGIGGMDLGLERAGWECVAQVEWDDYCTKVLEKHWPDTPRWRDIHDLDPNDLPDCDAVVGGFPCQPVSLAGSRLAQDDERWLWPEFFRIVRGVRPRYVIVENVPGLASAGMGDVLGDLASIGYDAEWQSIPAAAVGAPHLRWRFFIVAYPNRGFGRLSVSAGDSGEETGPGDTAERSEDRVIVASRPEDHMADTEGTKRTVGARADQFPPVPRLERRSGEHAPQRGRDAHWSVEPDVGRVAHGIPSRVDRLRGLGNAVVPQVAEWVGHVINRADADA